MSIVREAVRVLELCGLRTHTEPHAATLRQTLEARA